jgi:hypothetical protein
MGHLQVLLGVNGPTFEFDHENCSAAEHDKTAGRDKRSVRPLRAEPGCQQKRSVDQAPEEGCLVAKEGVIPVIPVFVEIGFPEENL